VLIISTNAKPREFFSGAEVVLYWCDKLTAMVPLGATCPKTGLSSRCIGVLAVIAILPTPAALAAASGEEVYAKRCAACHDQTNPRIPSRESLQKIPATRILGGMERTQDEYAGLASKCAFRLNLVVETMSPYSILEMVAA